MNSHSAPDHRAIDNRFLEEISDIIEMVDSGSIWTKNPDKAGAEPTPGIYGINKPKGFYIDQEENTYILSVFLSPTLHPNLSRYQNDMTLYSDWKEYMIKVEC